MEKILDLENLKIRRLRRGDLIVKKYIHANILNMPLAKMNDLLKRLFEDCKTEVVCGNVFFDIQVSGDCIAEDVGDLYDYVENALTDVFCTKIELTKEEDFKRSERLGTYGLPKVNLKKMNYLRWIKNYDTVKGIGFKVQKEGSSWNRRMMK